MITKEYGKCILVCDNCMEEIVFDNFEDALTYKKKHDWQTVLNKGDYEDYCPNCQVGGTKCLI